MVIAWPCFSCCCLCFFNLGAKKTPEVKAKGGVIRYAVPVVNALLQRHLADGNIFEQSVAHAGKALCDCYGVLTNFDQDVLKEAAERFVLLYVALETAALQENADSKLFHVKPKLHLFMEMVFYVCRRKGSPREFWCYLDESHGHEAEGMAASRGGPNTSVAAARRLLDCTVGLRELPC